ncbi:helix-turn-helix transcriptional regulator [Catenulispora subtropica]|uniref:HTH cro/C1-type domain-containing protein n=1 Tax=Catenulispora subtropica TaxID=450798 RepID=A0ABN2THA6_9ACTN
MRTNADPDPMLLAFGLGVRRRREDMNWSLDVLADRSGLSRSMLIGVEHGRRNPSLKLIAALAQALNATMSDLVGEAEPRAAPQPAS